MNILRTIIESKKKEVAEKKKLTNIKDFENFKFFNRRSASLSESILNSEKGGIIAEFKRQSPSKGIINGTAIVEEVTTGYSANGASGLSILTDTEHFGGFTKDLSSARRLNTIPILRKDFIIDEYQILESKAIGADAILLIAAVLDKKKVMVLSKLAHSIDLEVLLEVHNEKELETLNDFINIIGVNNRNLDTFEVDTKVSLNLIGKIPGNIVRISESGISDPEQIKLLKEAGYNGFLIGEKFMHSENPVAAFSKFLIKLNS